MSDVRIGVAVGQKHERTGIAVLLPERRREEDGRQHEHFTGRHIERMPAGTNYPQIAARLAELAAGIRRHLPGARLCVHADATGLGGPIMDILASSGLRIVPVYFNHGDRRIVQEEPEAVVLGKAWLVSRLQGLLQTRRLHLPNTPEAHRLAKELAEYQIEVAADANEHYGAFAVGSQDELVTALGLAVQAAPIPHVSKTPAINPLMIASGYSAPGSPRARRW